MVSSDTWNEDYKLAQQHAERLSNQIQSVKNVTPGTNVAAQKYLMGATWNTLLTDMENLDKLKYLYENEPRRFPNVNKREMASRIQKIEEIKEYVQGELSRDYKAIELANQAQAAMVDMD